jgi:hypothetical protein
MRQSAPFYSFNGGEVSDEAISRVDFQGMRMAASSMVNWLPRVLGSMRKRPGTQYIGATKGNNAAQLIPFNADSDSVALLEITNGKMRVWDGGDTLVTRASVSTTISNGGFSSLTNWTNEDDPGCTSDLSSNELRLLGTGTARAARQQAVAVSGTDDEVTHAIDIDVTRGPVYFSVGSSSSNASIVPEQTLKTGKHSIAFVPGNGVGTIYVNLSSDASVYRTVNSCNIASAGTMELDVPWTSDEIGYLQYDQSADVIFVAAPAIRPQRIERRGAESWSVVDYFPEDGPFDSPNLSPITVTPSATTGNITLTASERLFRSSHVGALWRMTHQGQSATATLTGDEQYTGAVAVIGSTNAERNLNIEITGTWTGTLTLQRAYGEPTGWIDTDTYTANTVETFQDQYPSETVYYRIGFKTSGYGSGSADVSITFPARQQTGTVRITGVTDSVTAAAEVLKELGRAEATSDWYEGAWSDKAGWPSSVAFHDGRLWWSRLDRVYGSVSGAFESYDDQEIEGDSAPVIRSIATGPVEGINWLLSLQRLIAGTISQEVSIRSSSFDEPLTPTQFTARKASTRGSALVPPASIDSTGFFVNRAGNRLCELIYGAEKQDYTSRDLNYLNENITSAGIVALGVQRNPDTRIWCVLSTGNLAVLTYERDEDVVCWSRVEMDGDVQSVAVLPGEDEDRVFFVVQRSISGVGTVRYLERMARGEQAEGGTDNWTMDCAVKVNGSYSAPNTTFSVPHLAGEEVHAWSAGAALRTVANPGTVTGGGNLVVSGNYADAVIGLPVRARWKSAKLAFGAERGSAITTNRKPAKIGLVLHNTHVGGIQAGENYTNMQKVPLVYDGTTLTDATLLENYEYKPVAGRTGFGFDPRIHIQADSPYSATVAAMVVDLEQNERGNTPVADPPPDRRRR